jgi:hypothetical protein
MENEYEIIIICLSYCQKYGGLGWIDTHFFFFNLSFEILRGERDVREEGCWEELSLIVFLNNGGLFKISDSTENLFINHFIGLCILINKIIIMPTNGCKIKNWKLF